MIGVSRAGDGIRGPAGREGRRGDGEVGVPASRAARDPCDLPSASSRSPATAATDLPRRFAPAPPPNLGFPNPCREIYTFPLLPGFCFSLNLWENRDVPLRTCVVLHTHFHFRFFSEFTSSHLVKTEIKDLKRRVLFFFCQVGDASFGVSA